MNQRNHWFQINLDIETCKEDKSKDVARILRLLD